MKNYMDEYILTSNNKLPSLNDCANDTIILTAKLLKWYESYSTWLAERLEKAEKKNEDYRGTLIEIEAIIKSCINNQEHKMEEQNIRKEFENKILQEQKYLWHLPNVPKDAEIYIDFLEQKLSEKQVKKTSELYAIHKKYGTIKKIPEHSVGWLNKSEWETFEYFPTEEQYFSILISEE
jgi:hypothetical protein